MNRELHSFLAKELDNKNHSFPFFLLYDGEMDSQKLTPDFNCIPWKTLIGKIFHENEGKRIHSRKRTFNFY